MAPSPIVSARSWCPTSHSMAHGATSCRMPLSSAGVARGVRRGAARYHVARNPLPRMWSPQIGRGARQNELGGRGAGSVYNTPSLYAGQFFENVRLKSRGLIFRKSWSGPLPIRADFSKMFLQNFSC